MRRLRKVCSCTVYVRAVGLCCSLSISIACLWFPISVLYSNCVCKMRRFGDTRLLNRDLEIRVRGHSRSSKVTPFDSLHMVSYYRPIVTLCLKCTVFEIWRHIGRKSPKKPTPPSFGTFLWGDPLRIFRQLIPCQKLESWGYQMVYISRSCFRCARHNTSVWQTDRRRDGRPDTSLSQRPALA